MKKLLIVIFALNILVAQELEPIQNNRTLTIYKDSFAIIKEPILWNLKDGKNNTSFNNLSPNIVFDSPFLNIDGVEVGSQTLNKNFYSTDSYLKKNIGSLVEVKPINDSAMQGALLDINSSSVSINTNKGLIIFQRSRVEYILLKSKKIQTRPLICGNMGQQPFLKKRSFRNKDLVNSKYVDKYGIYLPNHANLKLKDIDYVSRVFKKIAEPFNF